MKIICPMHLLLGCFQSDQINVMHATLNGYRSSLKNSTVNMNCNGSIGVGL